MEMKVEMEAGFCQTFNRFIAADQGAASHVERSLGLEFGEMEDVIDILFHRKVTAAQTFVLKLVVSFENQILFKQKKHRQLTLFKRFF